MKKNVYQLMFLLGLFILANSFTQCKKDEEQPKEEPKQEEPVTSGTFTDARDQKVYKWVVINGKTWMAENLAYLPSVSLPENGSEDTGNESKAFYYVYDYRGESVTEAKTSAYYKTIGVLYNWNALETVAPKGWHVPTEHEWADLQQYLGTVNEAGNALKEKGTEHWLEPNKGAVDSVGFTMLSSGYRFADANDFREIRESAYYWTTTEDDDNYSWTKKFNNETGSVLDKSIKKTNACAIRCIKD
jgi:uncharacterized protein (TIGR02145 family)